MTDLDAIVRDYLAQCGLALAEGAILSVDTRDVYLNSIETKGDPVLLHLAVTVQIKHGPLMDGIKAKWSRERVGR